MTIALHGTMLQEEILVNRSQFTFYSRISENLSADVSMLYVLFALSVMIY